MKTISLRLDEKTLKKTCEIAEAQNLERSDALRQSISAGLEMLSKKIAVEKYAEGNFLLIRSGVVCKSIRGRDDRASRAKRDQGQLYPQGGGRII